MIKVKDMITKIGTYIFENIEAFIIKSSNKYISVTDGILFPLSNIKNIGTVKYNVYDNIKLLEVIRYEN